MHAVKVMGGGRDQVGESPVWSAAEQALYWVDIEGCQINRFDWVSQTQTRWRVQERVGCIALSVSNTLIASMETGVFELHLGVSGASDVLGAVSAQCLATIAHPAPDMRFNDGRVDPSGRFWISTMRRDMSLGAPDGGLYCLDTRGLSAPLVRGLITPNGLAFSADGQRAYLSDSHPSVQKIWALDVDSASATVTQQREWVDMSPLPGRPDGAAMDSEGCYWICGNDAGLVHRFSPQGELLASLPIPVGKVSMCVFGGPELRHLFVTSIKPAAPMPGFDAALDGAVFVLEPGVQGRTEPLFSQFPVR